MSDLGLQLCLQRCYKKFYKGVTKVLQRCYKGVTRSVTFKSLKSHKTK